MNTNTLITFFLISSLVFSSVDSRIAVERNIPRKSISKQLEKSPDRSKREFDPQASPLNQMRSASQWRPKNQQPEGQVYLK